MGSTKLLFQYGLSTVKGNRKLYDDGKKIQQTKKMRRIGI